jgi:Leucine-rich repeat (LRR) protein
LKILILKNSTIRDFSQLQYLKRLLYLDISSSSISDPVIIENLAPLSLLQYLDVSNNMLRTFPEIPVQCLYELHMSSNMLSYIPSSNWLFCLRILNLSDNLIAEPAPLAMCPFLVELHLARNQIRSINHIYRGTNAIISISLCRQLKILNLAGNTVLNSPMFDLYVGVFLPKLVVR